jgi:hypothetical protein
LHPYFLFRDCRQAQLIRHRPVPIISSMKIVK